MFSTTTSPLAHSFSNRVATPISDKKRGVMRKYFTNVSFHLEYDGELYSKNSFDEFGFEDIFQ